ncbi:MAG: D-aminoacyl-tRNA deacylase [Thermodesulfobacterium sp.]|uniref:D-aminoacyl-tRNA deacylase n=1 Tax=Candidatus Thermodesulfobacterium syntrophicum TaxID=3060442 RepID=A0AAE3P3C1_9BACT|nr:D-aminoacyl-tRNA deacylase [Candidatus Thermodesulfobacterium syntrophicum]
MKIVIQRVKKASVMVDDQTISEINHGLLALACVEKGDNEKVLDWIAEKLVNLRIFSDENGRFNLNIKDVNGEILLISNFTVCGFLKKGTRPTFHLAESPEVAKDLLSKLAQKIREKEVSVKEGVFGVYMQIKLVNDGPVTLFLEYPRK